MQPNQGDESNNEDTCLAGVCSGNGFKSGGREWGRAAWTAGDNADTCNGSGTCQPNHVAAGTNCGDAGTECTNQDKCDGNGACTDNGFKSAEIGRASCRERA